MKASEMSWHMTFEIKLLRICKSVLLGLPVTTQFPDLKWQIYHDISGCLNYTCNSHNREEKSEGGKTKLEKKEELVKERKKEKIKERRKELNSVKLEGKIVEEEREKLSVIRIIIFRLK